jgi:hypothetical protein
MSMTLAEWHRAIKANDDEAQLTRLLGNIAARRKRQNEQRIARNARRRKAYAEAK